MIKLLLVISLLTPQLSFAEECDFKTGITKSGNKYLYSKECHKKVGKTVSDLKKREEQVLKLDKVVELKDLAIEKSHQRIELWRDTTFKLEDRVNTIDSIKETNKWLYFGLGILVMGAATYGAGRLK